MLREDFALHVPPEPGRGEVRRGEDDRRHVADAAVGEHADVLEAVCLLDEADRLLDSPAREVSFDDSPHRLERPVDGKRGQQHHREATGSDLITTVAGDCDIRLMTEDFYCGIFRTAFQLFRSDVKASLLLSGFAGYNSATKRVKVNVEKSGGIVLREGGFDTLTFVTTIRVYILVA